MKKSLFLVVMTFFVLNVHAQTLKLDRTIFYRVNKLKLRLPLMQPTYRMHGLVLFHPLFLTEVKPKTINMTFRIFI